MVGCGRRKKSDVGRHLISNTLHVMLSAGPPVGRRKVTVSTVWMVPTASTHVVR